MSLRIDVLTLFPEAVSQYATTSVLGRAQERGVWQLHVHDIRDASDDPHRTVDDTPFGGGAGMVMRAELIPAWRDRSLRSRHRDERSRTTWR